MKPTMLLAIACAVGMAAATTTVFADTTEDRMQKAPTKTMGNEGKLPAPEGSGPAGRKGPTMRMGDDGKLPANNNMSGQLPAR